jgi:hypothetical protein
MEKSGTRQFEAALSNTDSKESTIFDIIEEKKKVNTRRDLSEPVER